MSLPVPFLVCPYSLFPHPFPPRGDWRGTVGVVITEGRESPRRPVVSAERPFHVLVQQVRAGDPDAAAELVRRYEPAIRRAVHVRLADGRLRRRFDSMDVCQSVLASFFVRAALGQYELERPEQLLKLLATMARNKLTDHVRRERAAQCDARRVEAAGVDEGEFIDPDTSPSQQALRKELVEEVRRRLPPEERRLQDLRDQGREWAEIAAQVGGSSEALRKRLARAIDEVARELGVEESSPDCRPPR